MKPYLCYIHIVRFGEVRKLIGDNSLNEVYCVTELKLMIHSHFIEILMILPILSIQCQCLVVRNCGVCNCEVLLYYISSDLSPFSKNEM